MNSVSLNLADNKKDSIYVNKITKIYKARNFIIEALPTVSFSIKKDDRVTIRGENGCGKSTLLKILATLVLPTSGQFSIFGNDYPLNSEIRTKIAYIPEIITFDHSLNPTQLWNLINILRDEKNNQNIFFELCAQLKIKSWLDKPLGTFSLGMKKRFMLSLWLSLKPKLLLLDEFDSGLDENGRGLIEDLLKSHENLTILSITHNPSISLGKNERVVSFDSLRKENI